MYSQNYSLNSQLKIWMITLLLMIVLIILVGGLTRLTDSGLSITTWELFVGTLPPLTSDKWIDYFDLYSGANNLLIFLIGAQLHKSQNKI